MFVLLRVIYFKLTLVFLVIQDDQFSFKLPVQVALQEMWWVPVG